MDIVSYFSFYIQLHRLAEDGESDETRHLPVMPHSSQVKTKAACNCGQKQADKDDPFDHKVSSIASFTL